MEHAVDVAASADLGKLFQEHSPRLLRVLQQRMDPAMSARRDADDILHTAFLKAQARWVEFPQSGMAAYPWLYRIVMDSLLDDHAFQTRERRDRRAEVAWPDRSSHQLLLGLVSPLTSPSSIICREEIQEMLRTRVQQILAQLKAEHREIFCMHLFDQLSLKDIGQVLGIVDNAVRARYARARLRFRTLWVEEFGQEGFVE
jgi:RNA polymerase sigma factor (sigma-70 family)